MANQPKPGMPSSNTTQPGQGGKQTNRQGNTSQGQGQPSTEPANKPEKPQQR